MVVRDEHDSSLDGPAVDRHAERARPPKEDPERAQAGEGVPAPTVLFAAVNEPGVDAERDVVQKEPVVDATDVDCLLGPSVECRERGERVVAVEAEVPREVVARPERDDDEREVAVDRDLRHAQPASRRRRQCPKAPPEPT